MLKAIDAFKWLLAGRTGLSASVQTLFVRVLVLFVNVSTGMITARGLGDIGRGEQATMILWPSLITSLVSFGLPSALLYQGKKYEDKKSEFFSAALIASSIFGCLAIIVGWIGIPYWMTSYADNTTLIARYLMLTAPVILISSIFQARLQIDGQFSIINFASYATPFLTLIGLIFLFYTGQLSPTNSCFVYILPTIPVTIWMAYTLRKTNVFVWPSWKYSVVPLLTCGMQYYGMELLGRVSLQIDQVLVIGMLSPSEMGLYSVVLSLSRMLTIFHSSISSVLLPKVTAKSLEETVYWTIFTARICFVCTGAAALTMCIFSTTILDILYGPSFRHAVDALRILLIEVTLGSATWILAQTFLALGKPNIVTAFQIIGLSLSFPFMLFLIPRYGILGAALSILISTIVRLLFIQVSFSIVLKVKPPNIMPTMDEIIYLRNSLSKVVHRL
jgi:enterobacterial common antigen flippase